MKVKSLAAVILTMFLFGQEALAQVEVTEVAGRGKVGTAGMQFLKIGVGARAMGMAESFVALANDASAIYYNPAGLAYMTTREVFFTHIEWPADISYEYAGMVFPVGGMGVVAAHVGLLTTGDMKLTVPYEGWTGAYFTATDWVAGLSFSKHLTDKFSVGGNVKYVTEFLDDQSTGNWAADFGTMFDIGYRNMRFAMSITNFGPDLKYVRDQFSLPINFRIGGFMDVQRNEFSTLVATVEGNHPNDNVEQFAIGLEEVIKGVLSLRMGYRTNVEISDRDRVDEPMEGIAFGAGVSLPVVGVQTKIDYAYNDMGVLSNAQRFTVSFNF